MPEYAIEGVIVKPSESNFENQLADAYRKRIRPICLCSNVEVVIAKIGEKYFIKRMPNSGQLHLSDCDHYEIPPELSGRGELSNAKAISEDENGITTLKLDFTLAKMTINREMSHGDAAQSREVKADPKKLTLYSLLCCLIEDSGMNRWSPKMEGKRNYYIFRKYLLEASKNKVAKKNPLPLFVPESFRLEYKEEIKARRRPYFASLKKQANKQPMGIIIGEIKKFEPAPHNMKMVFKHLSDMPFYLSEQVHKRVHKVFSNEMDWLLEPQTHDDVDMKLICISTFWLSTSGYAQVESVSMMMMDKNWLPFENMDDYELNQYLVENKRHFVKSLRYNLPTTEVMASALITDKGDEPFALYIKPFEADEEQQDKLDLVIKESDIPFYIWDIEAGNALNPQPNYSNISSIEADQEEVDASDSIPPYTDDQIPQPIFHNDSLPEDGPPAYHLEDPGFDPDYDNYEPMEYEEQ